MYIHFAKRGEAPAPHLGSLVYFVWGEKSREKGAGVVIDRGYR